MADKTITIDIVGDETIIDPSLDAFSKANGWTETINDPDNPGQQIPNPETQLEASEAAVGRYIGGVIEAYNAKLAAETARVDSIAQTKTAMDLTTLTATEM